MCAEVDNSELAELRLIVLEGKINMEHWFISFRCQNVESAGLWESLRTEVLGPNVCTTSTFSIEQQFKSGSLDSLVALADDLSKLDHQLESTVRKVERQYTDIEPNPQLLIGIKNKGAQEYLQPSKYLETFVWDISKYPPSKTLPELAGVIEERLRNFDDDLKAKTSKFIEARNNLSQATKKESGGMLGKDLNEVLTPQVCSFSDFINTEYIKTLVVVVPKKETQLWMEQYEFLSSRVIPQSTKQFNVDDREGFTLWRVVVLKCGQDEFVNAAKKNRWAVRDFEYNPEQYEIDKNARLELKNDFAKLQTQLSGQCKSVFSELYIAWTHLKAIRIYTESILRYSLPPQFFSIIVTPKDGREKKIMDGLVKKFLKPGEKADMYCSKELSEDGEDFFPFVFLRMPKY